MSLILRTACQDILDGVGLQNFHIEIDERSKFLQVVGECGENLVNITGIRLSRIAPSNKEIDMAVALLDDFMTKHAAAFHAYMKAKRKMDKIEIPMEVPELNNSEVSPERYGNGGWTLRFSPRVNENVVITVSSTGKITMPSMTFDIVENPGVKLATSMNSYELNRVKDWIRACKHYEKARQEKKEIIQKLATCAI